MNDIVVMRSLKAHGNLYGNADSLFYGESDLLLNIFFESNAIYKLHDDIIDTVLIADIIYIHDVGMHKSCC